MAGDEEVQAVARAIHERLCGCAATRPEDGCDQWCDSIYPVAAEAALAALDRVRSRPAGGTEDEDHEATREKVARAIENETHDLPSPVSGTEGEDHEAGMEAAEAAFMERWGPGVRVRDRLDEAIAAYLGRAPSPVSGTEPDTAKRINGQALVDDARLAYDAWRAAQGWEPTTLDDEDLIAEAVIGFAHRLRVETAGFSVDAGKPKDDDAVALDALADHPKPGKIGRS